MLQLDPVSAARSFKARRDYGQNFLIEDRFADYEASYASGKRVIEFGPGFGMLTKHLCDKAAAVLAIEKDRRLYEALISGLDFPNLKIVNSDFFSMEPGFANGYDAVIGNVPYNISGKLVFWLAVSRVEAFICVQKEFIDHVLAKSGTRKYSRISVVSSLSSSITILRDRIPPSYFFPKPTVESVFVRVTPKKDKVGDTEIRIISSIMSYKKKTLANALRDSAASLGLDKNALEQMLESMGVPEMRPFEMEPEELLGFAEAVHNAMPGNSKKQKRFGIN
ncbi:MAG: rRNA adenine N(6)-methyltransferase family protein [Candidatus Marsarchaeota archaeon]|jgi:16S rRNA (adenine1518-N6/adenine1519-N6)-dimethyltransferase|nr:rRNA adenine N(6)-methyltransferase family protein [Candidatus Marsarchaeota archaeon]